MERWEFEVLAAETNISKAEKYGNTESAKKLYMLAAKNYRKAAQFNLARKDEFEQLASDCESKCNFQVVNNVVTNTNRTTNKPIVNNTNKPTDKISSKNNIGNKAAVNGGDASDEEIPGASLSLDEALAQLNELIGLNSVKEIVNGWIRQNAIIEERKRAGLKVYDGMSYHMVFTGNPGTGKTTVARLIGEIYHALGLIEKGQLVETKRDDLVAGYIGQTATKTKEVIQKAIGGVLFIDEAYTLSSGGANDFGKEAIDTLLAEMENNRKNLVVIVAGYTKEMADFIDMNPGLQSRFKTIVDFPDYSDKELYNIFMRICEKNAYKLNDEADKKFKAYLSKLVKNKTKNFGNARDIRNLFEKTITNQSNRLYKLASRTTEDLVTIIPEDLAIK